MCIRDRRLLLRAPRLREPDDQLSPCSLCQGSASQEPEAAQVYEPSGPSREEEPQLCQGELPQPSWTSGAPPSLVGGLWLRPLALPGVHPRPL
eukprot:12660353-Alexandrium_andersonii.AAC.1